MKNKPPKPRSYWEPWEARLSSRVGDPPNTQGFPEEVATSLRDAWERSHENADWILYGTGNGDPGIAWHQGQPVPVDNQGIVAIRRRSGQNNQDPDNQKVCERIAACINACVGISEPVETLAEIKVLLADLLGGRAFEDDPRILSLAVKMLPLNHALSKGEADEAGLLEPR